MAARQLRNTKPLSDRTRRAAQPTAADWMLRDHAERAASSQQQGETAEQWMARTGQAPEVLPAGAGSGKNVSCWSASLPRTRDHG
jgi:hypothetical protein